MWEKEKMLFPCIFSLTHNVLKRVFPKEHQKSSCVVKAYRVKCKFLDKYDRRQIECVCNCSVLLLLTSLTLSQTSPGFHMSAGKVFWKQWEKEKLLETSNFPFSHSVF